MDHIYNLLVGWKPTTGLNHEEIGTNQEEYLRSIFLQINTTGKMFHQKNMIRKKLRKIINQWHSMFCILKKKKAYPAYVSKHYSNHEKQVIISMFPNGK